jgi:glucose/arabinose dehydrogenase
VSVKLRRVWLACSAFAALALVVASCGGAGGGGQANTPGPGSTASATGTPGGQGKSPGVLVAVASQPVAFDFAPDGRLFFTERTTGEIRIAAIRAGSVTPQVRALPPVVEALRQLAEQAKADVSQVELLSVTPKQWPDSCLGDSQSGEVCAEVVTAGYEVIARIVDGVGAYVYHTDEGTNVRFDRVEPVAAGSDVFAVLDVFQGSECGLLGIVVDPEFETNHYVYVYATQPVPERDDAGRPAIIRYTDVDGQGADRKVIVGDLPETNPRTCAHVSGNLHFGPDGYLYVIIGNFEEPQTAADLSLPLGKLLRINKTDGSAAPDNPFANQAGADARIFAYGFRNPFDFAFSPLTGKIYAPDNGPGNCDELNLIEKGADYGVPRSLPLPDVKSCLGLGGVDPIYMFAKHDKRPEQFGSNVAPAGVAFLTGDRYSTLGDGLLVCQYVTQRLQWLELTPPNFDHVTRAVGIADCSLNVEVRDGTIYYSNTQGIFELPPAAVGKGP